MYIFCINIWLVTNKYCSAHVSTKQLTWAMLLNTSKLLTQRTFNPLHPSLLDCMYTHSSNNQYLRTSLELRFTENDSQRLNITQQEKLTRNMSSFVWVHKENWVKRDSNLQTPDYCTSALPTKISSCIFSVLTITDIFIQFAFVYSNISTCVNHFATNWWCNKIGFTFSWSMTPALTHTCSSIIPECHGTIPMKQHCYLNVICQDTGDIGGSRETTNQLATRYVPLLK